MSELLALQKSLEARGHNGRFENSDYLCNCVSEPSITRQGSNTRSSGTSNQTVTRATSTTSTKTAFDPAAYAVQLTKSRNLSTPVRYTSSTSVDTVNNMVLEYRSGYAFFVPRPKQTTSPTIPDSVKDQIQNSDQVDNVITPKPKPTPTPTQPSQPSQPTLDQNDVNDINDTVDQANNANSSQDQGTSGNNTGSGQGTTNNGQPTNGGTQTNNGSQPNNGQGGSQNQQTGSGQYNWSNTRGSGGSSGGSQSNGSNTGTNTPTTGGQGNQNVTDAPSTRSKMGGGWLLGLAVVSMVLGARYFKNKNNPKKA